jgi:hypothetical protein
MTAEFTVSLRHATAADEPALRDLAALESVRLPAGPFLVGEVDGAVLAALSLIDGTAIADPFHRTAELVDLLRTHGAAKAAAERRERSRGRFARRRVLRPALTS